MVMRDGRPRSVMNAYTDLDGVPTAADGCLLTELLRDTWGFDGTVVADYFAVAFLHTLHGTSGDLGAAAAAALTAGIDVELPTVHAFGEPLEREIADGRLDEAFVDRALRRVLAQKIELGLLDGPAAVEPSALAGVVGDAASGAAADLDPESVRGRVDLDGPENRALARRLAEEAIVLLRNDGTLPLAAPGRIAVIGPTAEDPLAVLGCYAFPTHVGVHHPEAGLGIALPTLVEAVRAEFPAAELTVTAGTSIDGGETDGIADAARAASGADVVVLALGDRAGLFGRGTSGEGCDAESLELPGAQSALLEAVLDAGTPTIVTMLAGRPYVLGTASDRAAGIVQSFFPGEEGTTAIAGVLSGRVNPSGRLPVSVPATPGAQPSTYLAAPLAQANGVSSIDPTPRYAFGHGLSYTSFEWSGLEVDAPTAPTDGTVRLSLTVSNTGDRAGADVVQLYLHDPVASVVRPVRRLLGFRRLELDAGASVRLSVEVPADLASFTGRDGTRIVEPGGLELGFGRSAAELVHAATIELTGPVRRVDHTRALHPSWEVAPA
jgi:beta-xylosidase